MCIDSRALNKQTSKDRYPLPQIDDLLDRLRQAKALCKLYLAQDYHHIAMAKNSIYIIVFCPHLGQWEYAVMPFGCAIHPTHSRDRRIDF